jgi:hypothetical protein
LSRSPSQTSTAITRAAIAIAVLLCAEAGSAQTPDPANPETGSRLAAALGRALSSLDPLPHRVDIYRSTLASQVASFPLGSSSGAFTYVYDPKARTFSRRTHTLGPWFADRASTLGRKGEFNAGSASRFVSYDGLDGHDLGDGSLHRVLQFEGEAPFGNYLKMSLAQQTIVGFATYAVADSVDAGVVVPFVRSTFHASVSDAAGGTEDLGRTSAAGLGDIQLRARWNLVRSARFDGAAQVDFWLPTGDPLQLSGAGTAREQLSALASLHLGDVEAHVNAGYRFALAGESPGVALLSIFTPELRIAPANEWSHVTGAEWAVMPRVTITGELVGRYLRDHVVFEQQSYTADEGEEDDPQILHFDGIQPVGSSVHQWLGTVGVKLNVTGTTVLSGHLLFSPARTGLTIRPALVLGIEHAF